MYIGAVNQADSKGLFTRLSKHQFIGSVVAIKVIHLVELIVGHRAVVNS